MPSAAFTELDPKARRRLLARSLLRVLRTTVILFLVYYLVPVEDFGRWEVVLLLVAGILVFFGVLAWQMRTIIGAEHPQLRAVEAAGSAIPLLIVLFALTYLTISQQSPSSFSESLDHNSSLYFTITVLATVGFGDIVAKANSTRMVVSLQMVLDLVLIGVMFRLLTGAARAGIQRQRGEPITTLPDD